MALSNEKCVLACWKKLAGLFVFAGLNWTSRLAKLILDGCQLVTWLL